MRKLIAFDDDTFDKLKQLGRDRMATLQELADEAFADLLKKHGIPDRPEGRASKERRAVRSAEPKAAMPRSKKKDRKDKHHDQRSRIRSKQGQRAARENIPAEANPYQDGSEQHALWAAGHEKVAGAIEANESEGS